MRRVVMPGRPPRWRPIGRVVDGTVRPFPVVPGAERPWVSMLLGDPAFEARFSREELDAGRVAYDVREHGWRRPHLGALSTEDIERGQAIVDNAAGDACVLPETTAPLARSPWYINLRPSGSYGVPLTSERRLEVQPLSALPVGAAAPPSDPSTNLTRVWPQLYPPGADGGERARSISPAPVIVGAGATVTLIQLPELARGIAAVIKKFGQNAADFTNLVWSFVVKGASRDPVAGITHQFGQIFLPVDLPGTGVQLNPGDDFLVQVTNTGGAAVANVRARVDLYEYRV
jgi:hypothetical protein